MTTTTFLPLYMAGVLRPSGPLAARPARTGRPGRAAARRRDQEGGRRGRLLEAQGVAQRLQGDRHQGQPPRRRAPARADGARGQHGQRQGQHEVVQPGEPRPPAGRARRPAPAAAGPRCARPARRRRPSAGPGAGARAPAPTGATPGPGAGAHRRCRARPSSTRASEKLPEDSAWSYSPINSPSTADQSRQAANDPNHQADRATATSTPRPPRRRPAGTACASARAPSSPGPGSARGRPGWA